MQHGPLQESISCMSCLFNNMLEIVMKMVRENSHESLKLLSLFLSLSLTHTHTLSLSLSPSPIHFCSLPYCPVIHLQVKFLMDGGEDTDLQYNKNRHDHTNTEREKESEREPAHYTYFFLHIDFLVPKCVVQCVVLPGFSQHGRHCRHRQQE